MACTFWDKLGLSGYLVDLVCFVYLVDLVHLVSFVQPKNQTDQTDQTNQINQMDQAFLRRARHRNSAMPKWLFRSLLA